MSTITTKHKNGDIVFFMYENTIKKGRIISIKAVCGLVNNIEVTSVMYLLQFYNFAKKEEVEKADYDIYTSLDEIIEALKEKAIATGNVI